MSHFFMGAINIKTNKHEPSFCASKENTYKCPECDKKVKFCKGKIKQPYFSHYKSNNPCVFYQKPSESHIHKEAKRLLKHVIDSQYPIQMVKTCESCDEIISRDILYSKNMRCQLEYKFEFWESKKSADVAIIDDNGIIQYIFEIYHTHKTSTKNRPEPWFEVQAQEFIQFIHQSTLSYESFIQIPCVRDYTCNTCEIQNKEREIQYRSYIKRQDEIRRREEQERIEKDKERQIQEKRLQEKRAYDYQLTLKERKRIDEEHRFMYQEDFILQKRHEKERRISEERMEKERRRIELCRIQEEERQRELKDKIQKENDCNGKRVKKTLTTLDRWWR
jgi:hypothetical protein